eukprot:3528355-Rhodomonas_salina.4
MHGAFASCVAAREVSPRHRSVPDTVYFDRGVIPVGPRYVVHSDRRVILVNRQFPQQVTSQQQQVTSHNSHVTAAAGHVTAHGSRVTGTHRVVPGQARQERDDDGAHDKDAPHPLAPKHLVSGPGTVQIGASAHTLRQYWAASSKRVGRWLTGAFSLKYSPQDTVP